MIENSSVASVEVVERGDQVGEDWGFNVDPSGGAFGLQEVDGPQDRGPGCFVRSLAVDGDQPRDLVWQQKSGLDHGVVIWKSFGKINDFKTR